MERPSWKELSNKIDQAKEAVSNGAIRNVDPVVIAADAIELDYQVSDLQNVLLSVLDEVRPKDYVGSRPPQKSYKPEIIGSELFAFRWISKLLGCEANIKFCLKQDCLYLVSLHRHRKGKGG